MSNQIVKNRPWWLYGAAAALIIAIIASLGAWLWYNQQLMPVSDNSNEQAVTIESGSSAQEIADFLEEKSLINSSTAFDLYVRRQRVRNQLQAGIYLLSPSLSTPEIANKLVNGETASRQLTVIDGDTLGRIKQRLSDEGYDSDQLAGIFDRESYEFELLESIPSDVSIEGYIFPETYKTGYFQSPRTLIELGLAQMQQQLSPAIRDGFKEQGLNIHEALTVASIVEREATANEQERRQIAQVFLSRLAQGEPLGADITACYAAELAGEVEPGTVCDEVPLGVQSPYNTRLSSSMGLPPGPIGAPGLSALKAVADPADTSYLFYFHGDNGQAYFSTTYEEHLEKIDEFCQNNCG